MEKKRDRCEGCGTLDGIPGPVDWGIVVPSSRLRHTHCSRPELWELTETLPRLPLAQCQQHSPLNSEPQSLSLGAS